MEEIIRESYKFCGRCKSALPYSQFSKSNYKYNANKDGLDYVCRTCQRESYHKNAERNKAYEAMRYERDHEKRLLNAKDWYYDNKEKHNTYKREYRKTHWEMVRNKEKRSFNKHRTKILKKRKVYSAIRSSIMQCIKRGHRSLHTEELIGCTIEFFKQYIQSLFLPWMTWENHGRFTWHLDHVIPVSAFNFEIVEDQKKCFHYTNWRPMQWRDNIVKSDKLPNGARGRNTNKGTEFIDNSILL